MNSHPLILTAAEVRAVLNGTKTQHRVRVKFTRPPPWQIMDESDDGQPWPFYIQARGGEIAMPQNTTDLLARAHHARLEVQRIEREMALCRCEYEARTDFALRPCWKGEMVDYDESERRYEAEGDDRPGGWCGGCKAREQIRTALVPARRRLAGLKSAIWAAAKKCAERC